MMNTPIIRWYHGVQSSCEFIINRDVISSHYEGAAETQRLVH